MLHIPGWQSEVPGPSRCSAQVFLIPQQLPPHTKAEAPLTLRSPHKVYDSYAGFQKEMAPFFPWSLFLVFLHRLDEDFCLTIVSSSQETGGNQICLVIFKEKKKRILRKECQEYREACPQLSPVLIIKIMDAEWFLQFSSLRHSSLEKQKNCYCYWNAWAACTKWTW